MNSLSKTEVLSNYYINLDFFIRKPAHYLRIVYDQKGIPMFRYDPPLGLRYNPTTVALHALRSYQCRKLGYFFKLTLWLVEEMHVSNGEAFLFIRFPFPPRSYRSHWVSGMTQGLAISVMTRAYILTERREYLDLAIALASGMLKPINEGRGCLYKEGDDVWIEEYPEERPVRHVLNGLIFALLGLHDLYLCTNDLIYYEIVKLATATLERKICLFDIGIWSRYDSAARSFADPDYHLLNTVLLFVIAKAMHSLKLHRTAVRWFVGYRAKVFSIPLSIKILVERLIASFLHAGPHSSKDIPS